LIAREVTSQEGRFIAPAKVPAFRSTRKISELQASLEGVGRNDVISRSRADNRTEAREVGKIAAIMKRVEVGVHRWGAAAKEGGTRGTRIRPTASNKTDSKEGSDSRRGKRTT